MEKLQERLLELLKEIDYICKKHNITYYIDGGSAIGAIRHRGFIPWDDDIDIVMTRDNFKKFESIIDEEIPDNRKYESYERNKKYTMLYSRYCDKTSTSILRTSLLDVFESGVFIDIFVLDPIPSDKKIQEKYLKTFRAYAEYINPYYYDTVVSGNNIEMFKIKILGKLLGRKKLHKYINRKLFSYKEKDCEYYCFRFDLFPFIYKKNYFQEPKYMMFEDFLAPVPTEITDYLKVHYGETWMIIPDHDNQEVHNVVTNLNVSYKKFKNDYVRYLKKDALQKYKEFHNLRINIQNTKLEVNKGTYLLNAIHDTMSINKKLDTINISKLYQNKEYSKLYSLFSDYYDTQLNKNNIKNNIVIDIKDNTHIALKTLITYGYYYQTKKIINILTDKYPDLEEEINLTEKLNDYYYKEDFKNYRNIINDNYSKYCDNLDFIRGKVNSLIYEKKETEAFELLSEKLKIFTEDDFLLKYKADILIKKNKKDAIVLYNKVLDKTNNGILILEIKNILEVN